MYLAICSSSYSLPYRTPEILNAMAGPSSNQTQKAMAPKWTN